MALNKLGRFNNSGHSLKRIKKPRTCQIKDKKIRGVVAQLVERLSKGPDLSATPLTSVQILAAA